MENNKEVLLKLQNFLNEVSRTGEVWTLENEVGFATTQSTIYADNEGKPVNKLCFWESKERALEVSTVEWKTYQPTSFPLGEFLEQWCVGIANQGYHIELNMGKDFVGYEAHPLELAMIIIEKLNEENASVPLQNYMSLQDFHDQLKQALS
ncbi:DUF2750 domain-containing protein [Halosquirtibacter xylanolyticus]|uniref:DUF2750 domain-containing protein n=1 Tax=Halosquirtibacter xylanolyticus TaxID=3374599 RepID=UPI0037481D97|nr:DUF2750 domain-containing protein [Prolixibacteraceae bacterium]